MHLVRSERKVPAARVFPHSRPFFPDGPRRSSAVPSVSVQTLLGEAPEGSVQRLALRGRRGYLRRCLRPQERHSAS